MTPRELDGKLVGVAAVFECGGCGREFRAEIDPAHVPPPGWSTYDVALDAVRARGRSIQGGYILCRDCTSKCDNSPLVPKTREGSRDEVRRALGID